MSVIEEPQRGGLGLLGQSSHEKYMARHFVDMCVGLATFYGLESPGIESRWRRDFPHPPGPALGPTKPPVQCVPGLFAWLKAARAWR